MKFSELTKKYYTIILWCTNFNMNVNIPLSTYSFTMLKSIIPALLTVKPLVDSTRVYVVILPQDGL
jgi:hypothetical protein